MRHTVKKLTVDEHISPWELVRIACLGTALSVALTAMFFAALVHWG
jgi:hypothetical protein